MLLCEILCIEFIQIFSWNYFILLVSNIFIEFILFSKSSLKIILKTDINFHYNLIIEEDRFNITIINFSLLVLWCSSVLIKFHKSGHQYYFVILKIFNCLKLNSTKFFTYCFLNIPSLSCLRMVNDNTSTLKFNQTLAIIPVLLFICCVT